MFGTPQLQRSIRQLCTEFKDIFSVTVKSEQAKVPAMDLKVKKTVKKYLDLGVIEPSPASEYSQVHLVPKGEPNDWRFCLDYVRLNEATVGVESWPIPNIS